MPPASAPLRSTLEAPAVSAPADFQVASFPGVPVKAPAVFGIKFGCIQVLCARFGSGSGGSGQVRLTEPVEAIRRFRPESEKFGVNFGKIIQVQFRDRFGWRTKGKDAKINYFKFFSLQAHKLGVIGTENPRVGGSIPPLGTIFHSIQ